jgi:hypothetical protein
LGDSEHKDNVWLFSVEDVEKFFPAGNSVSDLAGNRSAWWTRTTAEDGTRARYITEAGYIQVRVTEDDHLGLPVYNKCGLRPAFWLTYTPPVLTHRQNTHVNELDELFAEFFKFN